ncbi:MAG TPA: hypothetical protein VG452_02120 [Egibacteraceae bacterium]|nr:hypothetical protein [Actinomycetota bacterium]HWB70986.1 hypothetical protein [Egibacteraceae bacterium]
MSATDAREVRRPWLPAPLAAHGFDADSVQALSYVLVDEQVDDAVTVTVLPWPAADGSGRLRFDDLASAREIGLSLKALRAELYKGWLGRRPRVGDVFAATLSPEARAALETQRELAWERPLAELVDGPVYDLSAEARMAAKLAFYAGVAAVHDAEDAQAWQMLDQADTSAGPAPVRSELPGRTEGAAGG